MYQYLSQMFDEISRTKLKNVHGVHMQYISEHLFFTKQSSWVSTKDDLISEGILTLVTFLKKDAKYCP